MDRKALIAELEGAKSAAKAILEEFQGKEIPAEKRQELDTAMQAAGEAKAKLDDLNDREQKTRDLAGLSDYLNSPRQVVPHGLNGDADDRKALLQAGWEIKSGTVWAPTSLGKLVEFCHEDVLFGAIPTGNSPGDLASAAYFKGMRAAFSPEYRKAYKHLLENATRARTDSMMMALLSPEDQKALAEGVDVGGGFLVPPDVQTEMLVRLPQFAIMRKHARVQTTSRDMLKWPRVQPASATAGGLASGGGSVFSSGFVGDWAGETPSFTDTDPQFGLFEIPIRKIRVATKLSNDFIADAAVNVLAFLSQNGAENMALVEDMGFIQGDATPLKPQGILNSSLTTVDVEGSTSDTISNTTSSTGSAPKIIDLCYALPSQYLAKATWVMRRSIEGKVRKLVDGQGRYLWQPYMGSAYAATPRDLLGYPVENSEFMPADGTNANKVILFGDLSQYIIAQRAQISTVILRERFADTDQTGIILFERVGGAFWNTDAARVGIV